MKKRLVPLAGAAVILIAAGCGSSGQNQNAQPPTVTQTTTVIERVVHTTTPPRPTYSSCGGYVQAVAGTTSCDFANNVFYEFYEAEPDRGFTAYSPATGRSYSVSCSGGQVVTCTAGNNAKIRFPMSAVDVYTDQDAAAYASSHDLGTGAAPSATQSTQESSSGATPNGSSFCSTHACIDNFNNGTGYIVQCADSEWSHSGGRPGACSYHGGETGRTYP